MRQYKYIWLPCLILVYFVCMMVYYGPELLATGQTLRFWLTAGAELLVIVALYFFLRRRQQIADCRKDPNLSKHSKKH